MSDFEISISKSDYDIAKAELDKIDLDYIRKICIQNYGWNEEYSYQIEDEYRDFLIMYKLNPEGGYVATRHVDDFWHAHILYTSKYVKDCKEFFGFYLNHKPELQDGRDLSQFKEGHERMKQFRKKLKSIKS